MDSVFVEDYPEVVKEAETIRRLTGMFPLGNLKHVMTAYAECCLTPGDHLQMVVEVDGSGHLRSGEGGDFLHFGNLVQAYVWMKEAVSKSS